MVALTSRSLMLVVQCRDILNTLANHLLTDMRDVLTLEAAWGGAHCNNQRSRKGIPETAVGNIARTTLQDVGDADVVVSQLLRLNSLRKENRYTNVCR